MAKKAFSGASLNNLFLALGIAAYAIFFTFLFVLRYRVFFAYAPEDLAIYNQIAWNTIHGKWFYSSITHTIFYEHLSLIYIPISLIYWIFPNIVTLYFVLSLALSLGAVAIYKIANREIEQAGAGLFFSFSYLLFPLLHYLNFIDFRPEILSIPFFLFAFYYFRIDKFWHFLSFMILILMCGEYLSAIIFMFGIYAVMTRKSPRWRIVPIFFSLLWLLLALNIVLPLLGYADHIEHDYFSDFKDGKDSSCLQALGFLLTHVVVVWHRICMHAPYVLKLFSFPFYWISLFSPGVLVIALPGFLQIFLKSSLLGHDNAHRVAMIVPFIFLASIYSAKKIILACQKNFTPILSRKIILFLSTVFFIGTPLWNFAANRSVPTRHNPQKHILGAASFSLLDILCKRFYFFDESARVAWELIHLIPHGASVATTGDLLPQLSHRRFLYEVDVLNSDWEMAQYVFLHIKNVRHEGGGSFQSDSFGQREIFALLADSRYELVIRKGDFILLKKVR